MQRFKLSELNVIAAAYAQESVMAGARHRIWYL